jgi:HEAT repeat protein
VKSKKRTVTISGICAFALGCFLVVNFCKKAGPVTDGPSPAGAETQVGSAPVDRSTTSGRGDGDAKALEKGFTAIFEGLKKMGGRAPSPVSAELQRAVASGKDDVIRRAFHDAIYDRYAEMEKVIPALRTFLDAKNPRVLTLAAEALYTVGDKSAYQPLADLIRNPEPVTIAKDDRITAANIFGKYREYRAKDDILALFRAAESARGDIAQAFYPLGVCPEEARKRPLTAEDQAINQAAKINRVEIIPGLRSVFASTRDLNVKAAAAWALATMAGDEKCVDYLIELAQPAIRAKSAVDWSEVNENAKSVRYLGSIQQPRVKEVLEQALDSPNGQVVSYALVNLVFNQGGSEKARKFIVDQLNGAGRPIEHDVLYYTASKIRDPEIIAAGEASDQRTGERNWRLYAGIRANWPIYNWIDQYVPKLNEVPSE